MTKTEEQVTPDTGRWLVGKVWDEWDEHDEFSWIVVQYQRAARKRWNTVTIHVDWELAENEQEILLSFRLEYVYRAPKKRGQAQRELVTVNETYTVLAEAIARAKELLLRLEGASLH